MNCIFDMMKFSNKCPLCRCIINFNEDIESDEIKKLTLQIENM